MNRTVLAVLGVIAAVVLGGALWFFSQGNAEPTTGVTAPPIAGETTATTGAGETTPETGASDSTDTATPADADTYELTDATTATFNIDEELRGEPKTVEATSDLVLGQIQIDREDLSTARVGTILVNARGFTSDSSFRDRAIRGPILDSDTFEFIEFEPTSIDGLEGAASVGDELTFTMTGDLTIRDVTQEVTFDVTATLTSDTTIEGSATTVIERGPFEVTIPSVSTVANVSEEVPLRIDFVAESA